MLYTNIFVIYISSGIFISIAITYCFESHCEAKLSEIAVAIMNALNSRGSVSHFLVNILIYLLCAFLIYFQQYVVLIVLVPSLVMELGIVKNLVRFENPIFLSKMILLLQVLMLYFFIYMKIFNGFDETFSEQPNVMHSHAINLPTMLPEQHVQHRAASVTNPNVFMSEPKVIKTQKHIQTHTHTHTHTHDDFDFIVSHKHLPGRLLVDPPSDYEVNADSKELLLSVFGRMPYVNFPDLKHRSVEEITSKYPRLFSELPDPEVGFLEEFKSPCWHLPTGKIDCLPYAYILGNIYIFIYIFTYIHINVYMYICAYE